MVNYGTRKLTLTPNDVLMSLCKDHVMDSVVVYVHSCKHR